MWCQKCLFVLLSLQKDPSHPDLHPPMHSPVDLSQTFGTLHVILQLYMQSFPYEPVEHANIQRKKANLRKLLS